MAGTTYASGLIGPKGQRRNNAGALAGLRASALDLARHQIANPDSINDTPVFGGTETLPGGSQQALSGQAQQQRTLYHTQRQQDLAHQGDIQGSLFENTMNAAPNPTWDAWFQQLQNKHVRGLGDATMGSPFRSRAGQPAFLGLSMAENGYRHF